MKGDFSRLTFAPTKHYRRVLMQQGRVEIDADGNEQIAIDHHLAATTSYDVIGPSGVPTATLPDGSASGGFAVAAAGTALTISKGRMYVDGLLIENEGDATLATQPDVPPGPAGSPAPPAPGFYVAYVDVWERLITAVDDPLIHESALGGPDTSARTKLVWQVKLAAIQAGGNQPPTCASVGASWRPVAGTGTLAAGSGAPTVDPLPCILPPETGYRRLENQLYRVEIHDGGGYGAATFKWSRENGSVVAGVVPAPGAPATGTVSGPTFSVTSQGRDASLGFEPGDWVEVVDDHGELLVGRGELLQVKATPPDGTITTETAAATPVTLDQHPKLRRWDQVGSGLGNGVTIADGNWIELEGGVQVRFSDATYNTGDYWLIPARTKTSIEQGHVEWPVDATNTARFLPPRGVDHHYAKLAIVELTEGGFSVLEDCRLTFPPLTGLQPQGAVSGPCTVVVTPGPGWEKPVLALFANASKPVDAEICFPAGIFPTDATVHIATSGHIKVSGAGWGTRLVAEKLESVLRFEGCASVVVRDLAAACGTVVAPSRGRDHMNGSLTFANCADVLVENVELTCASGNVRGATCITSLSDETPANLTTGAGSTTIRDSRLQVGEMQYGILLVHQERVNVTGNSIGVSPTLRPVPLADRLKDPQYLASVRRLLVSNAVLAKAAPAAAMRAVLPTNVNVTVGNQTLAFRSHPGLQSTWQTFLDVNAPKEFATQRDALKFVKDAATRVLTDPTARAQFTGFEDFFRLLGPGRIAVAGRGIVVGGRAISSLQVADNVISGVFQGISVGVSHTASPAEEQQEQRDPDRAGTLTIAGNRISVHLNDVARGTGRYGIFVGNAGSLFVENNHLNLVPARGIAVLDSDGIRVYGYLGNKIVVRHNHVTGFPTSIRVIGQTAPGHFVTSQQAQDAYLQPIRTGPLWLVADNVLELAQTDSLRRPLIVAPACLQIDNVQL